MGGVLFSPSFVRHQYFPFVTHPPPTLKGGGGGLLLGLFRLVESTVARNEAVDQRIDRFIVNSMGANPRVHQLPDKEKGVGLGKEG